MARQGGDTALTEGKRHVEWLPSKLDSESFENIEALEEAAYELFRKDWANPPSFRAEEVRVHNHPHKANHKRAFTYWHVVTAGQPETERKEPIRERLERIPWCKPVVANEDDEIVEVWENFRGRNKHVCIWFDRLNYIVILKLCRDHYLLKTAYCPKSKRRQQLHREYAR